jgi:hypothetical protein
MRRGRISAANRLGGEPDQPADGRTEKTVPAGCQVPDPDQVGGVLADEPEVFIPRPQGDLDVFPGLRIPAHQQVEQERAAEYKRPALVVLDPRQQVRVGHHGGEQPVGRIDPQSATKRIDARDPEG